MISFFRPGLICCLAAVLTLTAFAQKGAPAAPAATDDGWTRLQQSERNVGQKPAPSGKMSANAVAPAFADYLARADELKSFRAAHPNDPRSGEARRLEALMLVRAGYSGDTTAKKRGDDLVAEARADQTLPVDDRFALASLADFRSLRLQSFDTAQAQLDQFEKTARALIAEFPGAAPAYKTLLTLAKDCGEAQAARIARDLLVMPAPPQIKKEAQLILDRQTLIGQSLTALLTSVLAAKDRPALPNNQITIVYAWSGVDEGSLAIATEISAKAPANAMVIGVNLDLDLSAARKVATARALPGRQLYDPAGPDSPLARTLKLAGDNIALITNRQGRIASVSARPDLAAKIISAER